MTTPAAALAGLEADVARMQHEKRNLSAAAVNAWLPSLWVWLRRPPTQAPQTSPLLNVAVDTLRQLVSVSGCSGSDGGVVVDTPWTLEQLIRLLHAARALGPDADDCLRGDDAPREDHVRVRRIMVAAGVLAAGGDAGCLAEHELTRACTSVFESEGLEMPAPLLLAVAAAGEKFALTMRARGGALCEHVSGACVAAASGVFVCGSVRDEEREVARALRANAPLLGRTAALLAPITTVVAHIHRRAVSIENITIGADSWRTKLKRDTLLACSVGALAGGRGDALQAVDALFVIDALSMLHFPVTTPPHLLLIQLAVCVSRDAAVLARLGVLTTSVTTPPEEPQPRAVVVLYAFMLALGTGKDGRKDHWNHQDDPTWLDVSTLLLQAYRSSAPKSSEPSAIMHRLALDACMAIASSGVCSEEAASKIGLATWDNMLALYPTSEVQAADLARAVDSAVSGGMSQSAVVQCAERLEVAARAWPRAEWRRVAVVLVLRAVLRCDLLVLTELLRVAARVVRREGARDIARDAVLGADVVRKDQILDWYFDTIMPPPSPSVVGRRVAKL
jgi:hypothetical protein